MTWTVSNAEDLLYEACRTKGHKWVEDEPLWCTWTLERFGATCASDTPHILIIMLSSIPNATFTRTISPFSRALYRRLPGAPESCRNF